MKKFILSLAIATSFVPVAFAQQNKDPDWAPLASNNSVFDHARHGSFEVTTNKAGEQVAVMLLRRSQTNQGMVSLFKVYIPVKHCLAGAGEMTYLRPSGEFLFTSDYISKSNTINSIAADFLCHVYGLYAAQQRTNESKGL